MRLLSAILALTPALVSAQTLDITVGAVNAITDGGTFIGPGNCTAPQHATWNITSAGFTCSPLQFFFSTTNNCPSAPATTDRIIANEPNGFAATGTFDFSVNDLPVFANSDGGVTCGAAVESTAFLCGATSFNLSQCGFGMNSSIVDNSPPAVTYDAVPPSPPTIEHVEPLDGSLAVGLSVTNDTFTVQVTATDPAGNAVRTVIGTRPIGTVTIPGLQNGTAYTITATATDQAGNVSGGSNAEQGTPIRTIGFWEQCKNESGCSNSGCSVGGVGGVGAGLLIAAALYFRRRAIQ